MSGTVDGAVGFTVAEQEGCAEDLRLLALLHDGEPTEALISELRRDRPEDLFALPLGDEAGRAALSFLATALSEGVTRTDPAGLDELAADHAAIYLTHTHRVSPSESPWIDPEGLTSQEPMFQVRDWYRHWGVRVPDWRKRPDDHLVAQLQFLAHLFGVGSPAALVDASRFLDRHLLRWYGSFADGVGQRCWTPYWAAIANLTEVYLETLRDRLARLPDCERVECEPIETEKERRRHASAAETCASARDYVPGTGPTL